VKRREEEEMVSRTPRNGRGQEEGPTFFWKEGMSAHDLALISFM
jgi:hypothetical protein